MEKCYKCVHDAEYICPDCGTRICKSHMEHRYSGSHLKHFNFTSNSMCPVCWLKKRMVEEGRMINLERTREDESAHESC